MSKSYLSQTKVIDVDEEKVTLCSYSYALQKQIAELTSQEKSSEAIDLFLENSIKDWTLTDEEGNKLAITRDVLNCLAGTFVNKVLKEATDFNNLNVGEIKNSVGQ